MSTLGVQMQGVGISWLLYNLTGSVLVLGLIGFAQFVPTICLALFAGHAADRFDRRRILLACYAVELTCAAVLLALTVTGAARAAPMLATLLVFSAARTFENPAAVSLLPTIVPRALYPHAVAWTTSAAQAATIVGPALGGFLFTISPAAVFAGATLLLIVAALLAVAIPPSGGSAAPAATTWSTLVAGIGFIRRRSDVLGAVSMDFAAVLLGGATALLPVYARDILRVGPWGLGMLRSAPAVGALAIAVVLAHRPLGGRIGRTTLAAVASFGAATIVFGLSRSFVLSLAALVALGASDSISVVVRRMLVQLSAPDEMRGRVSAVSSFFSGTSNYLGQFESGITAAWFGTVPAVVLGGLGTLAVVLLWAWRFPALRGFDRLDGADEPGAL